MDYQEIKVGCLFHASSNENLNLIYPHVSGSYENKSLVFAARLPTIAAVFLHNIGRDITCRFSVDDNLPRLIEQYEGAFEARYPEEPGAIYIIPATYFSWARERFPRPENPRWEEDYVSEVPVNPIEKIHIPNVRSYILELIEKRMIILQRHSQGKTLEQRLTEYFTQFYHPSSNDFHSTYQQNYELLSNPSRIKAELEIRKQAR